jgi:hypothetical protein
MGPGLIPGFRDNYCKGKPDHTAATRHVFVYYMPYYSNKRGCLKGSEHRNKLPKNPHCNKMTTHPFWVIRHNWTEVHNLLHHSQVNGGRGAFRLSDRQWNRKDGGKTLTVFKLELTGKKNYKVFFLIKESSEFSKIDAEDVILSYLTCFGLRCIQPINPQIIDECKIHY